MITPLDIQNKEFGRAIKGYKEEEVDGFLDLLTLDWEKLIDENKRLKENVKKLSFDLARYQNSEGAVLETLEAAKSLMSDISSSAEKRAEILLKNADLDAQIIQREAKESAERLTEESNAMRARLKVFKVKFRAFLEQEQRSLESLSVELFLSLDSDESKLLADEKGFNNTLMFSEDSPIHNLRNVIQSEDLTKTKPNLTMGERD